MKRTLVLVRHGESEWNKLNLFTGWTDVDLSATGIEEAKAGGIALRDSGIEFDVCYTSYLKRAIHTLNYVLAEMDREFLPVFKTWELNERHYGALQGLNKAETAAKYGNDQVTLWRRSYAVKPPLLEKDDKRNAAFAPAYQKVDKKNVPLAESLYDTVLRVIPFYEREILPRLKKGENILIAAHGNSLRALVKFLDNISDDEIVGVNIPTGIPLVYKFDDKMHVISHEYIGDPKTIEEKILSVANQAKKK
ncbi:MAG TPA: 2,3-diphosphoglycerate-dependent phosphoglycerate mutase [Bacilli bacterium]|nr:2,3-diphosphoglycerate-dependent phosphoglycerate mutase [Bacilli bacterium]HPS18911.1 2,3-diphosphoglycerate-dependent phosphoglycerate mutase [Bacilli bacterium]